jgi:hypothetical protein
MNAYVTAPTEEKVWTTLGPEFGADQGKKAIIIRATYGLKSLGAAFHKHLADCMRHLGYTPCLADPDLWMKPEVDPDGNFEYYSYILCYVDDVLVIHHDAMTQLMKIDKYFKLKETSIGDPDVYLGAKLKYHTAPNGVNCWTLSPSKYVREAVKNCEVFLKNNFDGKHKLPKSAPNAFWQGYQPEIDVTEPLDPERASYYQTMIGVLLYAGW